MKSAYELAMERLAKNEPAASLSAEQRAELAEIDSRCNAKIAEKELMLKQQIEQASMAGDEMAAEALREELSNERRKLEADREEKKEAVRRKGG